MKNANSIIEINPEIMSGQPVFAGTRVPIAALFENMIDGLTVNEFINTFQGVTKEQVYNLLRLEQSKFNSHENFI